MAAVAAVGLAHTGYQSHCGTYFTDAVGELKLLHLAWHNRLRAESPSEFYRDFDCNIPNRELLSFSEICRLIYKRHESQGLRYALSRTEQFLADGSLKIDEPGVGFSCATFVKAIFDAIGRPLIVDRSWPPADNRDEEWLKDQIEALKRSYPHPEDQAHFGKLDPSCKWSRYKPEQIAYAAAAFPPAHSFNAIKKHADRAMSLVINEVRDLSEQPPPPEANAANSTSNKRETAGVKSADQRKLDDAS